MCVYSYTDHLGCGHRRIHVALPCPNAFDSSLPQCDPKDYLQEETVNTECPECKPAFDNKSPLEPQTSLLRPQGRILQEVYPQTKIKLTFNRSPIFREKSPSPEVEDDSHQFEGNLAQIDQQHNQFKSLDPYDLTAHRIQVPMDWLNDPEHAAPGREEDFTSPSHDLPPFVMGTGVNVIPTEPWSPSEHNTDPIVPRRRSRKHLPTTASEERRRRRYGFKIALPSPPPTPSTTINKTRSFRIKNGRILTARQNTLSTSQRKAMARAGFKNVRSLLVKTRRRIAQDCTSDEDTQSSRSYELSPTQRRAMACAGFRNVRKLSVISRRPPRPLC